MEGTCCYAATSSNRYRTTAVDMKTTMISRQSTSGCDASCRPLQTSTNGASMTTIQNGASASRRRRQRASSVPCRFSLAVHWSAAAAADESDRDIDRRRRYYYGDRDSNGWTNETSARQHASKHDPMTHADWMTMTTTGDCGRAGYRWRAPLLDGRCRCGETTMTYHWNVFCRRAAAASRETRESPQTAHTSLPVSPMSLSCSPHLLAAARCPTIERHVNGWRRHERPNHVASRAL